MKTTGNDAPGRFSIVPVWGGGKLDGCALFVDEHSSKDLQRSPVGASLLPQAIGLA
jgi:hypothetical protein